jgi:integrase
VWKGKANEDNAVRNAKAAMAFFQESTPLDDLTTVWIDEWIGTLKADGNAGGTINRKLASLSSMMTYARESNMCSIAPRLRRQSEVEPTDFQYYTQEEEKTILAHLSHWGLDDQAEVVCVLVDNGFRPSELWRVTERDIDLTMGKRGIMTTKKTKNRNARSVPMTTRIREIVMRRIEVTPKGEKLFPFNKAWLERAWARVRVKMGKKDDKKFIPYTLRHTFGSRLIQRGVPLAEVQKLMGHKTIQMTLKYAHLAPGNLEEAIDVLEDF